MGRWRSIGAPRHDGATLSLVLTGDCKMEKREKKDHLASLPWVKLNQGGASGGGGGPRLGGTVERPPRGKFRA
jgi:hypothetical protein